MTRSVDPIVFEIVWHRLLDVTEEMGIKYMRTSGSPILVGAYDASTAITLPDGQLVAMGPYITTQAHVMRLIIESVIKLRQDRGGINNGDMFICNDPYLGATHQPDVATVAPIHDGVDNLLGWVGSSGHWLDIGGSEPGGFNMNARSVFDEGLRLPPTKIMERSKVREDIVDLIMAQIREPLAELDLRGQLVANEVGRNRVLEIADEFGSDTLDTVMRRGISHVTERMRDRLRALPDGVWREVQYLDHDGHSQNVRTIVVTVTKKGDRLTLDFDGSDPEVDGFANCAFGGMRAASLSAVCIALGYDLTWNDGVANCVDIRAPKRTIVTADYPTPVSMATISAIIVTLNLVLVALSKMLLNSPAHHEEAMASWCGTSLGVSMVGTNREGILTVAPEASHFAAGCGARTYADGVDTGGIIINTTANIPSIEETEDAYPLVYLFRRQLTDSGGPGRFRGGVSGEVAIRPHGASSDLATSFAGVGSLTPNAVGVAGGMPGATVRFLRFMDVRDVKFAGELEQIPGRRTVGELNSSKIPFPASTIEYHNWQGGGGMGDPLDRDPSTVELDVRARLVSPAQATSIYGVILSNEDGTYRVDEIATSEERERLREARLERAKPYVESFPLSSPGGKTRDRPDAFNESIRYWDLVGIDFENDESTCLNCGTRLGSASDDFRTGCLSEAILAAEAGPVHGAEYTTDETPDVLLRMFYCPTCGRQLEVDLVMPGRMGSSSKLLETTGAINESP